VTRTQRQIEEHRKGNASLRVNDAAGRPCPNVPVWAEQEAHAFLFGCVVPDLTSLTEANRERYRCRLDEVFNHLEPPDTVAKTGVTRVIVPPCTHLGTLRLVLDRLAAGGEQLAVHVGGPAIGLSVTSERESAHRVAELYTLCFAHPAMRAIYWNGFWDGETGVERNGLLRLDLSPRPAFRFLQKLVDSVWHTSASGVTDPNGLFHFRGFFGDYRVVARVGEEPATVARFSFRRESVPGAALSGEPAG